VLKCKALKCGNVDCVSACGSFYMCKAHYNKHLVNCVKEHEQNFCAAVRNEQSHMNLMVRVSVQLKLICIFFLTQIICEYVEGKET
jgi:hypothetical protein